MKGSKIWEKPVSPLTIAIISGLFLFVSSVIAALINVLLPYFINNQPVNEVDSSYLSSFESGDSQSESNSVGVYKSSVISLDTLPINNDAYTLSDMDYDFFKKHDGTDSLKVSISGDTKKINENKIVVAKAYENGFIKRGYTTVEHGVICPDYFDIIAILYDVDGKYLTLSKVSIYSDQDSFSHIEMVFDNVNEGLYYVDFF